MIFKKDKIDVLIFFVIFVLILAFIYFTTEKKNQVTSYKLRIYSNFESANYKVLDSINNQLIKSISRKCEIKRTKIFPGGQGLSIESECEKEIPDIAELKKINTKSIQEYFLKRHLAKQNILVEKLSISKSKIKAFDEYSIEHDLPIHDNLRRGLVVAKIAAEKRLDVSIEQENKITQTNFIDKYNIIFDEKKKIINPSFTVLIIFSLILTILIFLSFKSLRLFKK